MEARLVVRGPAQAEGHAVKGDAGDPAGLLRVQQDAVLGGAEDVAEAYIPDGSRLCLLPAPEDRDGNGLPVSPKTRPGETGGSQ